MPHPDTSTTYHVVTQGGLLGLGHDTQQQAEKIAIKAASDNPDTTFMVVRMVCSVRVPYAPAPVIHRYT